MTLYINYRYYLLLAALLTSITVYSQVMDIGHRVDTLSNSERLSLRTNAVDWLLLIPNIGIEYDLKNLNYNRLSIGLNFRYNWQSSHTFKPGVVYNIAEIRAEVRNYYRIRLLSNYIEPKKKKWQRLISPRKEVSRHPTTTYYWGGYLSCNYFALKLGKEGKQGNAMSGGVMWGMLKPLYEFSNGNSLDLEFAAAAGITYAKYDCFEHDSFIDYYPKTGHGTTIMPTIKYRIISVDLYARKRTDISKSRIRYFH